MNIINNNDLIKEIESKIEVVSLLKDNEAAFDFFIKAFKPRFCWSSNQIEGNTLTLEETLDLIEYDEVASNHTFREYSEAKNLYRAINKNLFFKKFIIKSEWIKETNAIIIDSEKGYRKKNVYIGNAFEKVYIPPHYEEIPDLMEIFCNNLNDFDIASDNRIQNVIKKITEDHIKFERIHPFKDGNGRTGRMILNQQLINNGLLPICIMKTSKYNQAFRRYDKNKDYSLLEHIICKEVINTLDISRDLLNKVPLMVEENEKKKHKHK